MSIVQGNVLMIAGAEEAPIAIVQLPAFGNGSIIIPLPHGHGLTTGDEVGVVLSARVLTGPTLDLALDLPEDVRDSPHLAAVITEIEGTPIDGRGTLAAHLAATCRERDAR